MDDALPTVHDALTSCRALAVAHRPFPRVTAMLWHMVLPPLYPKGAPSNSFIKYHCPTQNSHCATTDRSSASPALNQCAISCDPQSPTQTEFQYSSWSRHLAFSDLMKTLTILSQKCDTWLLILLRCKYFGCMSNIDQTLHSWNKAKLGNVTCFIHC